MNAVLRCPVERVVIDLIFWRYAAISQIYCAVTSKEGVLNKVMSRDISPPFPALVPPRVLAVPYPLMVSSSMNQNFPEPK